MQENGVLPSWLSHLLACMGGCFGYCVKTSKIAFEELSKGLENQDWPVRRSSMSDDFFWTSSAYDIDNSALLLQRSSSSVCILNQSLNLHNNAGSTSNPPEFVNHGLVLWDQTRQQWRANKRSRNGKQVKEPTMSWSSSYKSLTGTNKAFSRPVPLADMVDFLVDIWEQEGLYD